MNGGRTALVTFMIDRASAHSASIPGLTAHSPGQSPETLDSLKPKWRFRLVAALGFVNLPGEPLVLPGDGMGPPRPS